MLSRCEAIFTTCHYTLVTVQLLRNWLCFCLISILDVRFCSNQRGVSLSLFFVIVPAKGNLYTALTGNEDVAQNAAPALFNSVFISDYGKKWLPARLLSASLAT